MSATPTQTATSSSLDSESPLPSERPSHDRPYNPQSYPRSTPEPLPFRQQPYSWSPTPQFTPIDPFRTPNKRTRKDDTDITPPSYDVIRVASAQRHSWPVYPNQLPVQQQQGSSAPLNSHQEAICLPGVDRCAYPPSSPSDAPQHEGSSSYLPTHPQAFDLPASYPPPSTPDHLVDPQPQSKPLRPVGTELFNLRNPSPDQDSYHNGVISPSPPFGRERMGKCLLRPLRHSEKAHGNLVVSSDTEEPGFGKRTVDFVFKTIPHQVYLHMLLRLPSLYFSRVARIFEEADLSLGELKAMALETGAGGKSVHFAAQLALEIAAVPPAYQRLKVTWEGFIDSVMREWKTSNIISALLLSAILTILQIQCAADDPLTRYSAMISLICAMISLLFGCLYIIRFGSMRKTYKAAEWALEAQRSTTVIWWNVWVLLAMPAIWLGWSLVLYIVCIMSFVWRTRPQQGPPPGSQQGSQQGPTPPGDGLSDEELLAIRMVITTILGVGLVYGCLIVSTFRRYGEGMDKAWEDRIDGWLRDKTADEVSQYRGYGQPAWACPNQPYVLDHGAVYRPSGHPPHMDSHDTPDQLRLQPIIDSKKKEEILHVPPSSAQSFPPEPSMTTLMDSSACNSLGLTSGGPVDNSHMDQGSSSCCSPVSASPIPPSPIPP